jgi:NHLM bacteriocin system ABC transporter ATP-binding protein
MAKIAEERAAHEALSLLAEIGESSGRRKTGAVPLVETMAEVVGWQGVAFGSSTNIDIPEWTAEPDLRKKMRALHEAVETVSLSFGVPARKVALNGDWYKQNSVPLLAFWNENWQPVAVLPAGEHTYELRTDAEDGSQIIDREVSNRLAPFAYQFYATFPARPLNLNDMLHYFLSILSRRDVGVFVLAGIVAGALSLLLPVFTGMVFSTIIPQEDVQQLVVLAVLLIIAATIGFIAQNLQNYALVNIEGRTDTAMQAAVWYRTLNLPATFFQDYSAGDLANRAAAINSMRQTIANVFSSSFLAGVASFFSLGLLFYYNVKLACVALAAVTVYSLLLGFGSWRQLYYKERIFELQGKISGQLTQMFGGMSKIRVMAAEGRMELQWAQVFGKQIQANYKAELLNNNVTTAMSGIQILATTLIFVAMFDAAGKATMITADFIAFNTAFTTFFASMSGMTKSFFSLLDVVPQYRRALPILKTPTEAAAGSLVTDLDGNIAMENVCFGYDKEMAPVVRGITIKVELGQFIAVVGRSGSGKSTLVRLLLGFEQPDRGTILYNGIDLRQLDVRSVRRQCGVVLQMGKVLPFSILYNIIGTGNLTEDDAWAAAEKAGVAEDIRQMPMKMRTMVGDQGTAISVGQRQRILIARALVHNPKIVMLDEATSALDNETQAIVMHSLHEMAVTRIVVAHRLSTIVKADLILVMHEGEIIERGTYESLMQAGGHFAKMAARQLVDASDRSQAD